MWCCVRVRVYVCVCACVCVCAYVLQILNLLVCATRVDLPYLQSLVRVVVIYVEIS